GRISSERVALRMPSGTFALLPSCSSSVPQSAANSKWSFQLSPKRLRRQRATVSNETGSQLGRSALRSLVKGSCELFRSCIKLFFVVARTEVRSEERRVGKECR